MDFKTYFDFYEYDRACRRQYRKSGIYAFILCGLVVYVGQSKDLHHRFVAHAENLARVRLKDVHSNLKYKLLRPFASILDWQVLEYCSKDNLDDRENYWIDHYKPIFNIKLGDGTRQFFNGTADDISAFVSGNVDEAYLRGLVNDND